MTDFFFVSEQHVWQQIGEKKLNNRNKNLQITTQHCRLIAMKFSRKITPSQIKVMVTQRNAKTPLCFL